MKVNGRALSLYQQRLKKGDVLRIPGNADQGKAVKAGLNLIIFARPGKDFSPGRGMDGPR